ncbi:MAG: aminoacetone oxidase family FAD-binding enzyme [Planctomycetota bacterium]|nr:aminoacetone oxidase family FAD-binding enzyme [Planctomycetota bacterium]
MSAEQADLAVIGAGAAGLMAERFAAELAPRGSRVALLEGAKEPGRKILISGGGRCNVLPFISEPADFFTESSRHVLRRLLDSWPLPEQRAFFEADLQLPLVLEAESGKLFPEAQQARVVRDALLQSAREAGAALLCPWRVHEVTRESDAFLLSCDDGRTLLASRLILATGGQSVPKTGSDGAGYGFARALGHSTLPLYPALVPLTSQDARLTALSGIALPVLWRARVNGKVVEERERELLITHQGFSGPAVLDASHWITHARAELSVDWGARGREAWTRTLDAASGGGKRSVVGALEQHLPARLAAALVAIAEVAPTTQLAQLDRAHRERLLLTLTDFPLPVSGSRGFAVAEVTGGGIPLGEVNPRTLESRACPGLYLCGEILDAFGRIGGFNFQWAWATGRLAGSAAAASLTERRAETAG